jgi:membrane protease YdiL (CAAX protease family)
VIITVYWLPTLLSAFVGWPFSYIDEDMGNLVTGVSLCIITIIIMLGLRRMVDAPTIEEYGLGTKRLGSNLILTVKLIFIIVAVEFIAISIFEQFGISFEGDPTDINLAFIVLAVVISPIFEETVYRMNAATLLARRMPIIWVSAITATWFIAKHIPMWHVDNGISLPGVLLITAIDIPIWIVITYYFLKRRCIWIPMILHVFNNAYIVVYNLTPYPLNDYTYYILVLIGIIFLIVFGFPVVYKKIIKPLLKKRMQFTSKTSYHLFLTVVLTTLLLITSEALIGIQYIDPLICLPIGLILITISILTIIFVVSNRNITYIKDG